jgi:uncharacterized protein YbbC (DUF1343 family)
MPNLTSALIYPALVAFEGSNLSVGRGTDEAFQRFGAPWLPAAQTASLLQSLYVTGVQFEAETFTPRDPGDRKFAGQRIPGVRIRVVDRERVHVGRLAAAILWAVDSLAGDSLRVTDLTFDLRFGSSAARRMLQDGGDHDSVIDRSLQEVFEFTRSAERFFLYR